MVKLEALHAQGLSYSEIAAHLGISKNAVAGRIYRERVAAGLVIPPFRPSRAKKATRRFLSRNRGRNKAKDPATRRIIEMVNASRLYDHEIAEIAGITTATIRTWRAGTKVGKPVFISWVQEALEREEANRP